MSDEKMKTYVVEMQGGTVKRITIPEDWKVTYGLLHPGTKSHTFDSGYVLRIYESKEKQRAVFTNVKWFMDTSISVQVRRTDMKGNKSMVNKKGKTEHAEQISTEEKWVDEEI